MNKNIFFIILVVLVVAAGIYISNSDKDKQNIAEESNIKGGEINMDTDDSMMKEDEGMMEGENSGNAIREEEDGFGSDLMMEEDDALKMAAGGEYVDYNPQLLERANNGNVVLFFHAGWCPTCKVLDSALKKDLSKFPKDLTILKVDYDNSSDLKKKYAVTYQHTLVQVDAQGNEINKWNGGSDLSDVLSKLK